MADITRSIAFLQIISDIIPDGTNLFEYKAEIGNAKNKVEQPLDSLSFSMIKVYNSSLLPLTSPPSPGKLSFCPTPCPPTFRQGLGVLVW